MTNGDRLMFFILAKILGFFSMPSNILMSLGLSASC